MTTKTKTQETMSTAAKTISIALWVARMAVEGAEVVVRGKRALDTVLGDNPWQRPSPPWAGGRGNFWDGR